MRPLRAENIEGLASKVQFAPQVMLYFQSEDRFEYELPDDLGKDYALVRLLLQ